MNPSNSGILGGYSCRIRVSSTYCYQSAFLTAFCLHLRSRNTSLHVHDLLSNQYLGKTAFEFKFPEDIAKNVNIQ